MDSVKFVHLYKMGLQPDFDGRNHAVELPIGVCHISHQDLIMCGTDKKKLMNEHNTKIVKVTQLRPQGFVMCEKCERLYKANGLLSWSRWVASTKLHGVKNEETSA